MQKTTDYFIKVRKADIAKVDGDLGLALWYSILRDYSKRFRPDKLGFVRISSAVFESDFGYNRMKVWRWNQRLAEKGLILIDVKPRGGRSFIGFRVIG